MNTLFEKQVYIRLSPDNKRFFYSIHYGQFIAVTREVRLVDRGESPASAELSDVPIPCLAPPPARIAPKKDGKP